MTKNYTLRVECWKCKEDFHLVVRPENQNVRDHYVYKIVPCPFCEASCKLTLTESQVSTVTIHRGEGAKLTIGSLLNRGEVFPTTEPEEDERSSENDQ